MTVEPPRDEWIYVRMIVLVIWLAIILHGCDLMRHDAEIAQLKTALKQYQGGAP